MEWSAIRIKAKTIRAAKVLTSTAVAWSMEILVRNFRCAVSQDISTKWHPKMSDQNNEKKKAEGALQATSRCALTTIYTILEAGQSLILIIAIVSANPGRHGIVLLVRIVRKTSSCERGLCRVVPDADNRQRVSPIIDAQWGDSRVTSKANPSSGLRKINVTRVRFQLRGEEVADINFEQINSYVYAD